MADQFDQGMKPLLKVNRRTEKVNEPLMLLFFRGRYSRLTVKDNVHLSHFLKVMRDEVLELRIWAQMYNG